MSIYLALAAISVLAGFGLLTRLRLPVSPLHRWYLAPGATMLVWAIALGVGVSLGLTLRTLSGPAAGAHDSRCDPWRPRRPTRMGGGETHRTADPRGDAARRDGDGRRRRTVAIHRWTGPGRLVLRRVRPVPLGMAQGHGGRPRAALPVRRAPEQSPLHLQCDARVLLPDDRCGRRHAGGRRRLRRVDALRLRGVVRGVGRRSGHPAGLARAVHRDRRHVAVGLRRGADPQLRQPDGVVVSARSR